MCGNSGRVLRRAEVVGQPKQVFDAVDAILAQDASALELLGRTGWPKIRCKRPARAILFRSAR
jgi:hypothetical protein